MQPPSETSAPPSEPASIPCLPETAPFTAEQRAYLNGFLAGLFSRTVVASPTPSLPSPDSQALAPLSILFGSQTGNAEALAKRIAREASRAGFAPTVHDMAAFPPSRLAGEPNLLVVTSTYGDGDPPDNGKHFWETLAADNHLPRLEKTRFSVCALGDSNYPKFCQFGKALDQRLAELGAIRIQPRQDCDVDFEAPFERWLQAALPALAGTTPPSAPPAPPAALPPTPPLQPVAAAPGGSRKNPFPARLIENRKLNQPGSAKDTRHLVLDLNPSPLTYQAGDALGVVPTNDPVLVEQILHRLDCDGEEGVLGNQGEIVSFRQSLLRHVDITNISNALLRAVAECSGDRHLNELACPEAQDQRARFLRGRDIVDLLAAHPKAQFTPETFVTLVRPLQPRLYSIASSPKAHPDQIHLCVAAVRYESLGRQRCGVCSTFLADRVELGQTPVPIFVQPSHGFRLPAAPDRPVIMIGPGTGIAPFRAFLQERRALGAQGRSWLFFGDQRRELDFLYRQDLQSMLAEGTLSRLDTAFSRDQPEKVYVQHRMLEFAPLFWQWLEDGAHVYVCGDAQRMAKDVDAALHEVIRTAGGKTSDQARDYVAALQKEKRYQRDVY